MHERLGEGTSEVDGRRIWLQVYRTEITSGSLTLHEHEAVRWVDADAIDQLDWAEADVPVIPRVKELIASGSLRCPGCRSQDVREIVSGPVYDRLDFEVYYLGGCFTKVERWRCADCGREWSRNR